MRMVMYTLVERAGTYWTESQDRKKGQLIPGQLSLCTSSWGGGYLLTRNSCHPYEPHYLFSSSLHKHHLSIYHLLFSTHCQLPPSLLLSSPFPALLRFASLELSSAFAMQCHYAILKVLFIIPSTANFISLVSLELVDLQCTLMLV